jgi:PAS domain S-box-containing protein
MHDDKPIRVLIIEDDSVDREFYKQCLQISGGQRWEFAESVTATEGINVLKTWRPDCTFLDFNLPDMNGIEVLDSLKDESGRPPCAVIMLTAYGGEELAVRAMKAGATDYVPKGHLSVETLAHSVMNAIDRFQMQQRIEEQRAALEVSGRRYQVLLEAIPQMVWTASPEGRLEYANCHWFEYTGLNLEEAQHWGWDRLLHPDDRERTWAAWEEAARTGSVFEIEHRIRRRTDGSYRWHLVRAVPMRGTAGEIANWFGTCTEIEDQKRAERAAQEERKLRDIGVLAGGIAHDFNNLLVGVLGGASCAMETLPASHPAQNMLRGVVQAGERAAELTRKMLAYAGKGSLYVEPIDVDQLVRDTCDMMRASLPKNIRLECQEGHNIARTRADAAQMRQVVVDVLTNAVEAIGESTPGKISVRTGVILVDQAGLRKDEFEAPAMAAGRYLSLEVQDNGCGMDRETQDRIFDPFFTTKFLGRGLGMAAVHGFARSQGGAVQVESAPGKGTSIRLLLPAAAEEEASRGVGR